MNRDKSNMLRKKLKRPYGQREKCYLEVGLVWKRTRTVDILRVNLFVIIIELISKHLKLNLSKLIILKLCGKVAG